MLELYTSYGNFINSSHILMNSFIRKRFNIFSKLLVSASKERFINKVWDDLEFDPNTTMGYATPDIPNNGENMPTREQMIKWVDSGAADNYLKKMNFNWQDFAAFKNDKDGTPLYALLIRAYFDYYKNGGSNKDKKISQKIDPYYIFMSSGLKVVSDGQDTSGADMLLLKSLENDKFIFVCPLTYEACKFMDSYECGGQGAKWCIGYEQSDNYWRDYVDDGNIFCLAYSKNPTPPKNELKWMIQLSRNSSDTQAWCQDDEPDETIPLTRFVRKFGYNGNQFLSAIIPSVMCDDNLYAYNSDNWLSAEQIDNGDYTFDESTGYSEDEMLDGKLYYTEWPSYSDEYIKKLVERTGELVIDFEDEVNIDTSIIHANNGSNALDISTFLDYLKSIDVVFRFRPNVEFFNGNFTEVVYEPEASNYKADIYFVDSNIRLLNYCDWSLGENDFTLNNCVVDEFHVCCSENYAYEMCKHLITRNDTRIGYESYEEEYEEESGDDEV